MSTSPKTNTQWGTGSGDKADWTAKSLNSLLSPSKSHTFPTISPSVSIAGFTCDIYLAEALWVGYGNTVRGWVLWMSGANFFRHLWADMLQGHRVSKAQTTSFQFRGILQSHYCSVSGCQLCYRARLDNIQDSLKVILTPWSRPSQCNVPHFSQPFTQGLFLSFSYFFHSHQSSLSPLLLSFQWTWPHISPDACCDRLTIPDTPPSSSRFPSPPKIER